VHTRAGVKALESQDAEAHGILEEARRLCEEQGSGVTITLVGALNDQFVIIFNVASLMEMTPADRDQTIVDIASKLRTIKSVARVCYEVMPDRRHSH
jgi:hypothetical protein